MKSFSVFVKEDILISFVKSFATFAVLLLILFTWNQFRFCLFVRHERHPEFYVKLFAAAARETLFSFLRGINSHFACNRSSFSWILRDIVCFCCRTVWKSCQKHDHYLYGTVWKKRDIHCHTNYFPSNQFIVKFFSKALIWRNFC